MERYKVSYEVGPEQGEEYLSDPSERRFHVGILGDFSGRDRGLSASGAEAELPRRVEVDADNVWELAGFRPAIRIEGGDAHVSLTFESFDDFHPDHLRAVVPPELGDGQASDAAEAPRPVDRPASAEPQSGSDVLGAILQDSDGPDAAPSRTAAGGLGAFIDDAVRPHLVRPGRAEGARERTDRAVRRVLGDPSMASLEALWRPVLQLVTWCTPNRHIHLHLIDCGRECFDRIARSTTDSDQLGGRILGDRAGPGADVRYSLLVAPWDLAGSEGAAETLARFAEMGGRIGAACVAGVDGGPATLDSEAWASLRRHPDAEVLAVFAPRLLARIPYGRGMEECTPPFEEAVTEVGKGHVWGSPAILASWLLIRALSPEGPEPRLEGGWKLEGLPFHTGTGMGGPTLHGCLASRFTDREADALDSVGVMPLRPTGAPGTIRVSGLRMFGGAR